MVARKREGEELVRTAEFDSKKMPALSGGIISTASD
jgi:hypothetical protein